MRIRHQKPFLWLPDLLPMTIVGPMLLFFLLLTTRPRGENEIPVDLPCAFGYEGCTMDERELFVLISIKDVAHVYVQCIHTQDSTQTLRFASVSAMNDFLHSYLPATLESCGKEEIRILIKAQKATPWKDFSGMLEVLTQNRFRRLILLVEPGCMSDERYPFRRTA